MNGLVAAIFVAWLSSPFLAAQVHAEDKTAGKKLYLTYCTGCHGVSGKGDGPAAKTLPVKPADHTDTKKMSQYSDEHLFTVISKGGASVGKSAQMPGWGAVLKESQIHEIIAHIRSLSESGKETAQRPAVTKYKKFNPKRQEHTEEVCGSTD